MFGRDLGRGSGICKRRLRLSACCGAVEVVETGSTGPFGWICCKETGERVKVVRLFVIIQRKLDESVESCNNNFCQRSDDASHRCRPEPGSCGMFDKNH